MKSGSQFIDDVTKVMLNIPIINAKIQTSYGSNVLDAEFGIMDNSDLVEKLGITDDSISLRQAINFLNKFLNDTPEFDMHEYVNVRKTTAGYPLEYLLFDYCLAALDGDLLNAKLYLAHAFHILGIKQPFYLLLNIIVTESLTKDKDVRRFLTLLASSIRPLSASSQSRIFGDEYGKRYQIYEDELKQLS